MVFRLAIVGRPNVGKSTLFNRLAGKKLALVDDTPGVTRDWREANARLGDLEFAIMDTAGFEDRSEGLEARMRHGTEDALKRASAALFLIDARAGVTPIDRYFAAWLRRAHVPVILVANKCEGRGGEAGKLEAFALGFGAAVAISAEHGEGLDGLYDALRDLGAPPAPATAEAADRPLRLAILGRPNVGKSTLVNRLLGEDRMLTGPEPGITRDAVAIPAAWRGRNLSLVDTAGLRRRAKVEEKLERMSAADALRAARAADVVVLVVDATRAFEKQDLQLARIVEQEGRALVLAVNKWDLVADRARATRALREAVEGSLAQARGVKLVTCSALNGTNLDRLMESVFAAYQAWSRKVSTADLNRWLEVMTEAHPPPISQGRAIRIRYMTQTEVRPPTFLLFVTKPADLPTSYLRYLSNGLRNAFDLPGVPIRLVTRKPENPYAGKKRSPEELRRLSRKHKRRR